MGRTKSSTTPATRFASAVWLARPRMIPRNPPAARSSTPPTPTSPTTTTARRMYAAKLTTLRTSEVRAGFCQRAPARETARSRNRMRTAPRTMVSRMRKTSWKERGRRW
jgi:hypothetical protein